MQLLVLHLNVIEVQGKRGRESLVLESFKYEIFKRDKKRKEESVRGNKELGRFYKAPGTPTVGS